VPVVVVPGIASGEVVDADVDTELVGHPTVGVVVASSPNADCQPQ
jgi:hypothetical protein